MRGMYVRGKDPQEDKQAVHILPLRRHTTQKGEGGGGEVVAVHDSSLERTAGLPQEVHATDLSTILGLDAGSWYSEHFAGERVPTLKELLDASRGKVRLMVELKYDGEDRGLLEETIRQIRVSKLTERCILACIRIDVLAPEQGAGAEAGYRVYWGRNSPKRGRAGCR